MKTVSEVQKNYIQQRYGSEPIILVDCFGKYSTVEVAGYKERATVTGLDSILSYTTVTSGQLTVTLNDPDGDIKALYDSTDLHKYPCTISMYTTGGPVVLFQGQINSPVTWSEGNRTLTFTVLNAIETLEIGFSPEEGQFDFVHPDDIGKAWPLAFGTVKYLPAVHVNRYPSGKLETEVCIPDPVLYYQKYLIIKSYFDQLSIVQYYTQVGLKAAEIAPSVTWVLDAYMRIIGLSGKLEQKLDFINKKLEAVKKQIELGEKGKRNSGKLKKLKADKTKLEEEARETVDELKVVGIPYTSMTEEDREFAREISKQMIADENVKDEFLESISDIDTEKFGKLTKVMIDYVLEKLIYEHKVKHDSFLRQTKAYNEAYQIYQDYLEVNEEICRQESCFRNVLNIRYGQNIFGTGIKDLLIGNLRVRGTFNGDAFTVLSTVPNHKNLAFSLNGTSLDPCGNDLSKWNRFFLQEDLILEGMYCLVKTKDGRSRIIQVEDQYGRECRFRLPPILNDISGNFGNSGLLESNYVMPVYEPYDLSAFPGSISANETIGAVPNFNVPTAPGFVPGTLDLDKIGLFNQNYNALVNSYLKANNIKYLTEDEQLLLKKLAALYPKDIASNFVLFVPPKPKDIYSLVNTDIARILEVAPFPFEHWFNDDIDYQELENVNYNVGAGEVFEYGRHEQVYVANILSSTIHGVYAYRTFNGERKLTRVPEQYYTVENEDLGPLTACVIKLRVPLETIPNAGWESGIFVNLTSSIGPSANDMLKHIVETYTDYWYDDTFDIELPDTNFAIFARPNVLSFLADAAWQLRCALVLNGQTLSLKFLAEEPTVVDTLTDDYILEDSMSLSYSETESLVTKMIATWKPDYLSDEHTIILRNNLTRYGRHEQAYDFTLFNTQGPVLAAATFWLIRYSNTWRYINFTSPLHYLHLDAGDAVTVACSHAYPSVGVIESLGYDPPNNELRLKIWTPVRAGEKTPYPAAFGQGEYPTVDDIKQLRPGGTTFVTEYP